MTKKPTNYTLKEDGNGQVSVYKDGKVEGSGALGVHPALELIFVVEGSNKKHWFIQEDGIVFRVDRKEWNIANGKDYVGVMDLKGVKIYSSVSMVKFDIEDESGTTRLSGVFVWNKAESRYDIDFSKDSPPSVSLPYDEKRMKNFEVIGASNV